MTIACLRPVHINSYQRESPAREVRILIRQAGVLFFGGKKKFRCNHLRSFYDLRNNANAFIACRARTAMFTGPFECAHHFDLRRVEI